MKKEYVVNGVKFVQKEIVGEQYARIMELLGDITDTDALVHNFIGLLGKNVVEFLDIILELDPGTSESGVSIKKRDFIAKNFNMSVIKEVIGDFFSFNDPFSLIFQVLQTTTATIENDIKTKPTTKG